MMERHFAARFPGFLALLFAALMLPNDAFSTEGGLWTQLPGNTVALSNPQTVSVVENHAIACYYECWKRGGCTSFCHDAVASKCYVSGIVTSLEAEATPVPNLTCHGLCPEALGYKMYDGRCIKLVKQNDTYSVARQRCEDDGGHLYHVKVLTIDVMPIFSLMPDNGISINSEFLVWLGGDYLTTANFFWSDGSILLASSTVWAPNEPGADPIGYCLIFRRNTMRVEDRLCGDRFWSICQMDV